MVLNGEVTEDFRKQVLGYGLTTAEIVYRRPDRHWLLQTYVWHLSIWARAIYQKERPRIIIGPNVLT
jgi:hypothetical protein